MIAFIEESRETLGVEPICKALQFAPSTGSVAQIRLRPSFPFP